MSSAVNHKKRSRYSEKIKAAAYRAESRKAYYRTGYDRSNRSILGRMASMLHRRAPRESSAAAEPPKEGEMS